MNKAKLKYSNSVIKFLTKHSNSLEIIHEQMVAVYEQDDQSYLRLD